jgi:hypothetical protein
MTTPGHRAGSSQGIRKAGADSGSLYEAESVWRVSRPALLVRRDCPVRSQCPGSAAARA